MNDISNTTLDEMASEISDMEKELMEMKKFGHTTKKVVVQVL